MTVHKVKSWPWFFQAIRSNMKLHDLRRNDRDYKVGDVLELHEFDPRIGQYTGEVETRTITFITSNVYPCAYSSAYLDRDAVILSLGKMASDPE